MIIILIDIPEHTTHQEINDFISPFAENGHLNNISIMALKKTGTHDVEFHGLVTIMPDPVANDVINKLNGKQINGKPIVIREYKNRYCHVDEQTREELSNNKQDEHRRRFSENYLI